jgi:hypothetical protein
MRYTGTNCERSVHHDGTQDYTWVKVFDPRCMFLKSHPPAAFNERAQPLRMPLSDALALVRKELWTHTEYVCIMVHYAKDDKA